MKKNTEYLQFLKEDLENLDSLNNLLTKSYVICKKIDLKKDLDDNEFAMFENLSTRFSRVLNFVINRVLKSIDKVELEHEGMVLEVLIRASKRDFFEDIEEVKDIKILCDDLEQEYNVHNLVALFKEIFLFTSKLLDIVECTKNYCKVKKYMK
jgi:hypothetical protein